MLEARLTEKIKRTKDVLSLRFKPVEAVDYLPGQFTRVMFDADNESNKELNKYLSFSTAPGKEYFEVTKKLSSSKFSQHLKDLKIDDIVHFKEPAGKCVFDPKMQKITFLIGGIGITPAISIIEHIIENKLDTDVSLFYSNRTPDDIAFNQELSEWESQNSNIMVCNTVTDCKPSDNKCLHGFINKDMIGCRIDDLHERKVFIFGPPKMVNAMKDLAIEAGVKNENLMTEQFLGYE